MKEAQENICELTLEEKLLNGIDQFMESNYVGTPIFTNWKDPDNFDRMFRKVYVVFDEEDDETLFFIDFDEERKDREFFERLLTKFFAEEMENLPTACANIQYGVIKYLVIDEEKGQGLLRAEWISWKE